MSGPISRFLAVFRLELGSNLRRPILYVWVAILALLAWGLSSGAVAIAAGDAQVGGQKAFVTSEFAVAMQLALLGLLIDVFFSAVIAGMSPVRDQELRVGELLNATPMRPREYIWGKFAGAMATFSVVVAAQIGLMVLFNHLWPGGADTAEVRGPFSVSNYLRPALAFLLPQVVLVAGSSFALGQVGRSPILVFLLPVALLLTCGFFLWEWSPTWLSPEVNRVLMLVDPSGFRWLNETWLEVDRGAEFYNTASIPLDLGFALSRLAFIAAGLGAVALADRHYARSLRGARASRRELASVPALAESADQEQGQEQEELPGLVPGPDRPLGALGMTSGRPGFLAGLREIARVELRELRASPGLYIFVPLIILQTIGFASTAVGAFDTPLLVTPGSLAVLAMGPLGVMVCLLLLFYTVESVLRERHVRLDAIAYATPLRTSSLLLGKVVAGATVGVIILLASLLAMLVVLLVQGEVPFDPRPFALVWGLLLVPTFILWCAFVAAVLALTRNRYATYAAGLAVLAFSGYRFARGEMNWVGNWALWNAVRWSDLSILEFDRAALVLNRAWALALAATFTAMTGLWFTRRDRDAAAVVRLLRPRSLLITGLKLSPVLVPTAALGLGLWIQVERGSEGGVMEKRQKDYWKQNLATWKDEPLPSLTEVDVDLELWPERSGFDVRGTYRLVNRTDGPLRAIPVTAGFHWGDVSWTWDGAPAEPDDRSRLFVFSPDEPLGPGEGATLGFSYNGTLPGGITKNGGGAGEFILPSGVVLTSFGTAFLPMLGFSEEIGVDDDNRYESKRYPHDFFEGRTDAAFGSGELMTTELRISAPADLTVNSVGRLVEARDAPGARRTSVWRSDQPVHFFNVVAGRWDVRRGDRGTAIYYHPGHSYNIEAMIAALDAAREYYSEWFYPYPWAELKISEFPALAGYAQGFPTNIPFSEGIGFLTDATEEADVAFMVTAHEAAHQWWGNIVLPGKGPGGNILSEGMAHFSTAMLMEQVKGPRGRIEFLKQIETSYGRQRRADEERPLVLTDGSLETDTTVMYDKGGWAFWMLLNHLGRDRALAGFREFIETYRQSDDFPVLQDLLAVLRRQATDPEAFDAFARQWFFEKVVPEFRLEDATASRLPDGSWEVSATLHNVGTGSVAVEVSAERGERFEVVEEEEKEGPATGTGPYLREVVRVEIGSGQHVPVSIRSDFEPLRLVVDPDVLLLQLSRDRAKADL